LNKEVDTGSQNVSTPFTLAYNNIIDDLGALSTSTEGINACLILKNIPYVPIHNIQAIVFYSRDNNDTLQTSVGLGMELYNSTNDPNLTTPLATTPVITSLAVLVYRYDFPSIDTYTAFTGGNSLTNIVNNTFAFTQNANITAFPTEITGDVGVAGDLTAENLFVGFTNVITEIGTKQATITDGSLSIARTSGLQDALNSKQAIITTSTDLECNSLTTEDLEVNGNINLDTNTYFDTIVIRRPTGIAFSTDLTIGLVELQTWVNGVNIMINNGLTSFFANWSVDKNVDIGFNTGRPTTNLYNNVIETGAEGTLSPPEGTTINTAVIIKNIPITAIDDI
jgi:hypothetical protein